VICALVATNAIKLGLTFLGRILYRDWGDVNHLKWEFGMRKSEVGRRKWENENWLRKAALEQGRRCESGIKNESIWAVGAIFNRDLIGQGVRRQISEVAFGELRRAKVGIRKI